ncbi:hypothetical protein C8Q74DRAFT_1281442 [Fomes fomentarius]|nr:hypothetical protein C8Q74DRAFT_1281442 [Fomes fomentarius]
MPSAIGFNSSIGRRIEPLTRAELQILPSLGVDLSQDTKLSDAVLRTRHALDTAQYQDHLSPSLSLGRLHYRYGCS